MKKGDHDSFRKVFERYSHPLYKFSFQYLKSEAAAEDLVQEVFLKIWNNRKELKTDTSFQSYLFTIALNAVRKHFNLLTRTNELKHDMLLEFSAAEKQLDDRGRGAPGPGKCRRLDGVVLIDAARQTKFLVISHRICPTAALTDPLMTVSMPPQITARTGTDALVHATESYTSRFAGPASELFALRAIELLARNLAAACENGQDLDLREKMQIGATMAMTGAMNSKAGLCHALAMPLCALYHMPHGQAVGMALPVVLAYNAPAVGEKIDRVFEAMGFADDGFARLDVLLTQVGVSARLGDLGFQESHMPTIVQETLNSAQCPPNPRDPTPEDIAAIVRRML